MAPASATLQGTVRHRSADAVAADPCLGRMERRAGAMVSGVHRLAPCREVSCRGRRRQKMQRLPDHQLPVYTVIAALYREAKSVGPLMQAIDAFDYPREKLQVILATRAQRSRNPRRDRAAWPDAACAGPDRTSHGPADQAEGAELRAAFCARQFCRPCSTPKTAPIPASFARRSTPFAAMTPTSPARRPASASTTTSRIAG